MTEAEKKALEAAGYTKAQIEAMAAGGAAASTSPPVYVGPKMKMTQRGPANRTGSPLRPTGEDLTTDADAMALQFYRWGDAELRKFQEKAFAAGLYGSAKRSSVAWGTHDEQTLSIWKGMVNRAAGFYSQGQKLTPWDALERAAANPLTFEDEGPAAPKTSHPDDIAKAVRETARELLGSGNVPEAKVKAIIARYTGMEAAAGAEGSTQQAESGKGFIEDEVKAIDPQRYDARKVVAGLRAAHEMLGGGSGS